VRRTLIAALAGVAIAAVAMAALAAPCVGSRPCDPHAAVPERR
jgi:hypothetical protein